MFYVLVYTKIDQKKSWERFTLSYNTNFRKLSLTTTHKDNKNKNTLGEESVIYKTNNPHIIYESYTIW